MRSAVLFCAVVVGALLLALPGRAYENQLILGGSVGYSGLPTSDSLPRNGVNVGLTAGWGINDAWGLQGNLAYGIHPDDEGSLNVGLVGIETTYLLDIVRFVPFAGVGLDGLMTVRNRDVQGDFAVHGLLGVDFHINRRWVLGADVRGYWVPADLSSDLDPFLLIGALRVSYLIDLF